MNSPILRATWLQTATFLVAVLALTVSAFAQASPAMIDACEQCHGVDGMGHGNPMIPVIAGMPAEHIEEAIYANFSGDRESLLATMANRILLLEPGDLGALVHYYSSYRAAE